MQYRQNLASEMVLLVAKLYDDKFIIKHLEHIK
jgi:hypothetical protein